MPKIYGPEHLIYLTIITLLTVLTIVLMTRRVKSDMQNTIIIKVISILLLFSIIWNRISIARGRENILLLWPDSFCGFTSLILSITVLLLRRDHKILHCVSYIGLIGGIVTLVYPDFIGQADSIFYPMTLSGLLHHTLAAVLVLLMLITGYLNPTIKNWVIVPYGLSIYMTYGLFLVTVIGLDDAMYIYEPILAGTSLNWFVLTVIFLPIHLLFLLIWELFKSLVFVSEERS